MEFFDDYAPFFHLTFVKDEQGRVNGLSLPGPDGKAMTLTKQP